MVLTALVSGVAWNTFYNKVSLILLTLASAHHARRVACSLWING